MFNWVDLIAVYLFGVKQVAVVTAVALALLSLDDLFVDLLHWTRQLWRRITVYRRHQRATPEKLFAIEQRPIAIIIAAWQEGEVIGPMAEAAVRAIDYENYHLFIGTYPNDAETQHEVDRVALRHPHVHKVVCMRPGPTTKADCLNNIIPVVFEFEKRLGIEFAGIVLHDAEDVIPPLGLRVYNQLLATKDLIQIPVYPLPRPLSCFTGGHYLDEFAEQHAKDMLVREALARQVPSAGVGTCFSRRALLQLMREGDGLAFDTHSLTEDYDIGIRLAREGMREIFVRYPAERPRDSTADQTTVVSVRAFFPETLWAAVRQKSRWITGISLQGWQRMRWANSFWMNYFLWRDRRGLFAHPVSFLANVLLLHILVLAFYSLANPHGPQFLHILSGDVLLMTLLWVNGVLLLNRLLHRMYFVARQYGTMQSLMSMPRMVWGNIVNFLATARALWLYLRAANRKRMAWDKTSHEFPEVVAPIRAVPLGKRAVQRGWLTREQLERALARRLPVERLGQTLLRLNLLTPEQLASLLAEQAGVAAEHFDPRQVDEAQLSLLPSRLARKYGVFPLRRDSDGGLVLASESELAPLQVNALRRRLGIPVRYVIVPQGTVTVALRMHCLPEGEDASAALLEAEHKAGRIDRENAEEVWTRYVSSQVLFGNVLLAVAAIAPEVLHQALLGYEGSELPIGRYLVEAGYLGEEALQQALEVQRQQQVGMDELLERFALPRDPSPAAGAV